MALHQFFSADLPRYGQQSAFTVVQTMITSELNDEGGYDRMSEVKQRKIIENEVFQFSRNNG